MSIDLAELLAIVSLVSLALTNATFIVRTAIIADRNKRKSQQDIQLIAEVVHSLIRLYEDPDATYPARALLDRMEDRFHLD